MTAREWFYEDSGTSAGPVTPEEMQALVDAGKIQADTLVWHDGITEWTPAAQILDRFGGHRPAPPPPRADAQAPQGSGASRPDASTFMGALKDGFARYADFGTRSDRPQFWYFTVWMFIGSIVTTMLDAALLSNLSGVSPLNTLFSLGTLIPSISIAVRRLHDIGRTGWWLLLVLVPIVGWIVLLVFYCTRTHPEANRWGTPA